VGRQGKGWSVGVEERCSVGGEEGWVHIGFVWFKKNIEQGRHIPTI
jgi:hypothetical protein